MQLGSCKDKNNVRWRLFERFQKRVKGLVGQHMNFVDYVDLVTIPCGSKGNPFPQFADTVDASVGGTVYFLDVKRAPLSNLTARLTLVAWLWSRAIYTIKRLGQNSRSRGFANSPNASKQKGMMNAPRSDGIFKRRYNVLLSNNIFKSLRAPFPSNNLIRHLNSVKKKGRKNTGTGHPQRILPLLPSGPGGVGKTSRRPIPASRLLAPPAQSCKPFETNSNPMDVKGWLYKAFSING